ncbi:AraC family transcriptional regulator [Bombilactobacillus bombi]|uniref:AraC family transcriptional regulator n=1 Tax=Bombilactobacillus bombi TaxID=1303590 RepID=UPI000E58ECB5|nr:AraC family transcriptional regulator [Bombilactobacillus bombi]AXX65023.1 AraC family transcriptional regulator [Bombilactobacillus bombi]
MSKLHHENVITNFDIGIRFYESLVRNNGYVPFHWHSSIEIVGVISGRLTFMFNGKEQIVNPQQFIVVPSGVVHAVENIPNQSLVLQVPLKFIENYYPHPENINFEITKCYSKAYKQIFGLLLKINSLVKQGYKGYLFDLGVIILLIMKELILNFTDDTNPLLQSTSSLKEIIVYINEHYVEHLSVNILANKFGYNSSYLSRIFKQQTGITIIQYIYRLRLASLYQDLLSSNISIKQLMDKNGLTNQRTARNLFKNMYGKLPLQIRQDKILQSK